MSQIQVPEGWELSTLEEMVSPEKYSIKRGPWGSSIKKDYFVSSGYKVYQQYNVIYNDFEYGNYFVNDEKFNELNEFEIKPGDFLISCSGTIGRVTRVPLNAKKGLMNQALLKISLNDDKILPQFFLYLLKSGIFQDQILSKGSAMKNVVAVKELKKIIIPYPKNKEIQKKIVQKLDYVLEQLEEKRNEILELQKKKVEFIEYFLKNINGYYFESLLKKEKYNKIKLNDLILNIKLGSNHKAFSNGIGIPVLRMPNIQEGKIDFSNLKYTEFSKKEEEKYLLRKNDVLINRTNSPELVGKSAVFEKNEKFAFASYIIRLRVNEKKIKPHFLVNYLNSTLGRNYVESVYVKTAGQANINSEHLKDMPIFLPEIIKQKSIMIELDKLEFKSKHLRKKLEHFETLERKIKNYLDGLMYSILDSAFRGKLLN